MKLKKGNFIIFTIIIISVSIIIIAAIYGIIMSSSRAISIYSMEQRALVIAEAGIDRAVWCLNHSTVCGTPFNGETRQLDGGEYVSTITTTGSSTREVEVTAYIPSQTNSIRSATIHATIGIDATTISFNYGVQVGIGGLELQENAVIDGNVYSNGSVDSANGGEVTGDLFVATGMALDESWEVQNQDQVFGQKGAACSSSVIDVAQSFKPNTDGPLSLVSLYIKKVQNPSDINVHIFADDSGQPAETPLSTGTLNSNLVTTTYNWVNVTFLNPTNVVNGTTYWLVVDAACENNKYWTWGKDSNNGFGNGLAKSTGDWQAASPVWSALIGDMNFKIFIGGLSTYIDNVLAGGDVHANNILNSTITGEAYYQSIVSTTVSGSACPNINCHPGSSDPPVQPLPVSDGNIVDWEADALAGGPPLVGDQTISADMNLGPIKIEGNLTITNGAVVTLQGPVWVEGNINFDVNAIIQLDPNFGAGSTVIIADVPDDRENSGTMIIQNNANFIGSGVDTSYIMLLSTYEGTATHAISVTNNTVAAIFYSVGGSVYLANNVDLKEVTAYKLIMSQNATVTYESGLANTSFTSGPGASWAIVDPSWRKL